MGACEPCRAESNELYEGSVLQSDMVRTMRAFLALKRKREKSKPPIKMPPLFKFGTAGQITIEEDDHLPAVDDFYPRLFSMIALEPAMKLVAPEYAVPLGQRAIRLWFRNIENRSSPGPAVVSDPAVYPDAYVSAANTLITVDLTRGDQRFSIRQGFPLLKFMRMLAKIAYCFAVAERGIDRYNGSEIQQLVLGGRADYCNFVGGVAVEGDRLTDRYLHHLAFRQRGNLETVLVHLFSSYDAPPYEVVLRQDIGGS